MSRQGDGGIVADGEMTLAFTLAAFDELLDPHTVFADARQWCRFVGVVADEAEAVEAATRRHGVRQDYEIGTLDAQSVLSKLKWEANTDRYVLVGTRDYDRELADYVGWEYRSIEEAAAKADWKLAADAGRLARLQATMSRIFRRRLAGPFSA